MAITVFGSVFVDIKGYPLGEFVPNGRNAGRVETTHGGVSRNVVENIGNLGLAPVFVSIVDDSGTGEDVLRNLKESGVDVGYVKRVSGGLGTWLAVFDSKGDVYASISKRPDLSPIYDILKEHGEEIFSSSDSVILEMDMPGEMVDATYRLAKEYDAPVYGLVSNISIAIENFELIRETECFVCNMQEAGEFFGEDFSAASPARLSERLSELIETKGIRRMVVTLGEKGAVYARCGGEHGVCPAENVQSVDTTGAGDAFFAGVAACLTYGLSLGAACRTGSRLAAETNLSYMNVLPRHDASEFGIDMTRSKA